MATKLSEKAQEESTYVIDFAWFDEDDSAVTPATMLWALSDENGDIVNSQEDIVIGSLSTTNSIVLGGDDLAIPDYYMQDVTRFVRYYGTYVSSLGTLNLAGEVQFTLTNHRAKA